MIIQSTFQIQDTKQAVVIGSFIVLKAKAWEQKILLSSKYDLGWNFSLQRVLGNEVSDKGSL